MKKLFSCLLLCVILTNVHAQINPLIDSAKRYTDANIVTNSAQQITAVKVNTAFNKLIAAVRSLDSLGIGDSLRFAGGDTLQLRRGKFGPWRTQLVLPAGGGGATAWGAITGSLSSQSDLVSALAAKQPTLVSGTNIKTVGGVSILGSGNIPISGGGSSDTTFYNIKSFGAVGDNSTNNTTAIQNAFDAAHVTGGTVFVGGGIFRTNPLTWYSNVRVTGTGKGSILKAISAGPIIKFFGTTAFDNTLNSATVAFSPIDNIQLDGTGVAGVTGMDFQNCAVMYFNNVRIFNCETAVKLGGVIIAHFNQCDFEFGKVGLLIKDGFDATTPIPTNIVTFDKGRLTYFTKQAILATQFAALSLTNSNIEQSGTAADGTTGGIFLKYPYVTSNEGIGLTLNNCWFEGVRGKMVKIEDGGSNSKHIISNNTFINLSGLSAINTIDVSAPSFVNNVYLSKNHFNNTDSATIKATGQSNIYWEEPLDAGITKSITSPAKFLPFNYNTVSTTDTVLTSVANEFTGNSIFNLPVNTTINPLVSRAYSGINIPVWNEPTFGGALFTDRDGNFFTRRSNGFTINKIVTDNNISDYLSGGGGGGGTAWNLPGNSGTNSSTDFLGTTDNVDLAFRVNNQRAGKINIANYNTSLGFTSFNNSATGQFNNAFGYGALSNSTTGNGNAAFGVNSLSSTTTGNNNLGIGTAAMGSNTSGSQNIALGTTALNFNVTGNNNVAIGGDALKNNTASDNTALGKEAGKGITTGSLNIAIGSNVMNSTTITGNDNIGIGDYPFLSLTSGSQNIAMGLYSLFNVTTGSNNIAIGRGQLVNATGNNVITLGAFADVSSSNLSNAIAIGANAVVGASNSMVLGNNVNVGIGTSVPTAKIQVVGLVEYADNAAAIAAGLTDGAFYRTGDLLKVVHP